MELQLYCSIIIYTIADRVFGPNTATQDVYDVAAKAVIKNAMEGINGKQFTPSRAVLIYGAYGIQDLHLVEEYQWGHNNFLSY